MTSAEIAVEKGEAEVALEAAIPALEEAAEALNDLKKDDITEIRSFAKPHILVQKVTHLTSFLLCCNCLLKPSPGLESQQMPTAARFSYSFNACVCIVMCV